MREAALNGSCANCATHGYKKIVGPVPSCGLELHMGEALLSAQSGEIAGRRPPVSDVKGTKVPGLLPASSLHCVRFLEQGSGR